MIRVITDAILDMAGCISATGSAAWWEGGIVKADTAWMRSAAGELDATASAIKRHLATADEGLTKLRSAAQGWTFLESLGQLEERWEELNSLLRDELEQAAENIRFNASKHDGNENWITETWHDLWN
ncbi:hypothetical protein AB0C51_10495 [Streptomyces pathocidini]|uniref:hypothetical protein n=1 Tax=Streptomyces pathocidini TaxID=1650571 RepID=UPI0033F6FC24